jgi:hypothetical protein
MYRRQPVNRLPTNLNAAAPSSPQLQQSAATAVGKAGEQSMEGLGYGDGDLLVGDSGDVDDAGDLFLRVASGNERRCYVAADVAATHGSTAREPMTARPLVRELCM